MHFLLVGNSGQESIKWKLQEDENKVGDSVLIRFSSTCSPKDEFGSPPTRHEVMEGFKKALTDSVVAWLTPQHRASIFDLNKLREDFPDLSNLDWFHGKVSLEPDIEIGETYHSKMERQMEQWRSQKFGFNTSSPYPAYYEVPQSFDTDVIFRISPVCPEYSCSLRQIVMMQSMGCRKLDDVAGFY